MDVLTKQFAEWKPQSQWNHVDIPHELYPWICDEHSMTKRFRNVVKTSFRVHLRFQQWQQASDTEINMLRLYNREKTVIREVDLLCDEQPCMFARTVFPEITLTGDGEIFHTLGTRPLGEVLFANNQFERNEFEFALLKPKQFEFERAMDGQYLKERPDCLWARRAICHVYGNPLLLIEIFLPAMSYVFQNQ